MIARISGALLAIIAGACLIGVAPARAADDINGVWLTDDGEGAVEISACGAQRCGRIVWLKKPTTDEGEPVTDQNNPSAGLRSRPVCGLQVVSGLKAQSNGAWDNGRVYDPEEGKSYDLEIRREGDRLKIRGYVGVKTLGETMTWSRAPRSLGRCAGQGRNSARP
ncbi:DUF2147 domain-containing protein [Terrarubrum flagellatum]|uniref:DUF2147 domain-containing protein n=1 Tax=Terrirubrum flagellatum TaxID=2895980 RepID=UPI00314552E4